MKLTHLRTFIAVADSKNVTSAARMLNLVQPAVSRHLKLLEEELSVTLFERKRQGMRLTDAGETLLTYARRALHELDRARTEIRPPRGTIGGVVTVGLLPSTSELIASRLVAAMTARYPGIQLRISAGYVGYLQQALDTGVIDIALVYGSLDTPALTITPLLEEKLWAIGSPQAALAAHRPMSLVDFCAHPLILPSPPHGLRQLVDLALAEAALTANVAVETNAMNVQKRLVIDEIGLSVLPGIAVSEDLASGRLAAAPLTDPQLNRTIAVAQSAHRQLPRSALYTREVLIDSVRDIVSENHWPDVNWLSD